MIPDLDIWRSANLLIKHHGADAPIHAAMRADAMLEAGDLDGFAVWKRILRAVEELQETAPRAEAACAVSRTAFNRFMDVPSQTPRGVYLKFMAGIPEDMWEERADLQYYENIMLRAIRADLERLAGEVRS